VTATPSNAEVVSRAFARWARGDFGSLDWAAPDFELVFADGLSPGRWRGEDAGRAWGEMIGAWADFRAVPEEIREIDDERVLVLVRNTGRSKESGLELAEMHTRGANIIHVRDGKITRLVAYFDRDQAVADLDSL
jgi:ketosteroid isomerase-like protein